MKTQKYNESIPKAYNDHVEVGTIGIDKLYTRLTFVCYLRQNLIKCPLIKLIPDF